jgi:hypothetical protein
MKFTFEPSLFSTFEPSPTPSEIKLASGRPRQQFLVPNLDPIVQRLGHRPFTAVTRVRIPLGSLFIFCRKTPLKPLKYWVYSRGREKKDVCLEWLKRAEICQELSRKPGGQVMLLEADWQRECGVRSLVCLFC